MKLYLDPGHGGSDSGATGHGLKEKDIVLDIALKIRNILSKNYDNIEVKMSRTEDTTVSLEERTNEANSWGADYFLSVHCNFYNSFAHGYEDYIYSGLSDSSRTASYQDTMHTEILKVNELADRGKKKANFHVLRESEMPALLTENGFIDNDHDAILMKQTSWRKKTAQGTVNGLAKAFNLQKEQKKQKQPADVTLYKVMAGSFKSRKNAEKRESLLHSKNFPAFITEVTISGEQWYRVQAGAFHNRSNAERHLKKIKNAGIEDAYILTVEPESEDDDSTSGHAILGKTYLSPELMNHFIKKVNSDAAELGMYYTMFGDYYGIRGDIAFAQMILETDYLRFTGVLDADQNNFAGIGATDASNQGASFATPRRGVLAHIQHLYAYASDDSLPEPYSLVDPRFDAVTRGSAETWEALNGKWAVPGDNYGQNILNIYKRMIDSSIDNLEKVKSNIS